MIGTRELNWRGRNLYLGNKKTGYSVVFSEGLLYGPIDENGAPGKMFKIQFPDGSLSKDHYNLSWAKDNARRLASSTLNGTHENGTA